MRIIIEGVAGTGKSSTLSNLMKRSELQNAVFIHEEDTLGELFSEMQDKSISATQHIRRLHDILERLERANGPIVLERFHHSYFALGIHWDFLREIDRTLAQLNFKTALLDVSDKALITRSLKRKERESEGWESGFIKLYGSAEAAVEAFKSSQKLRRESLNLSQLPSRIFNTESMSWDSIAEEILAFAGSA